MTRLMAVVLCILSVLCIETSVSMAEVSPQVLHLEWGYAPPIAPPAVKGFRLYQEGVLIAQWPGADITAGDATVVLVKKDMKFTLTAYFSDDTETPHSSPFSFLVPTSPSTPKDFMMFGGYEIIPLELESLWAAVVPYGPEERVLIVRRG